MQELYTKQQYRLIAFSSLFISISGLLLSAKTYFIAAFQSPGVHSPFTELYWVLKPLVLFLGQDKTPFDVWEIFLLFMLLVGSIIFFRNRKDTRLISFVFAVILISNIASLVNIIYYLAYILPKKDGEIKRSFIVYIYPFVHVFYLIFSFYILKIIKSKKELDVTVSEISTKISDTPKWQRFFHLTIDTLLMALVFGPLLFRFFDTFLKYNETFMNSLNNRFTLAVVLVLFRFLYYPFFEIIFGSTPAKFLTESRVINAKAVQPDSRNIFLRTLCRNIPFDSVSFLFKNGWHDSLSETYVVKEKRIGFKTSKLLWFLILFVPYISFYYYGDDLLRTYSIMETNTLMNNSDDQFRNNSIKNINTSQVFALKQPILGDYKVYYLKVEGVNGDEITCKKLMQDQTYSVNYYIARDLYDKQKDTAETLKLTRQDFAKALTKTYGNTENPEKYGVDFFKNGKKYEIENIFLIASPLLENITFRRGEFNEKQEATGLTITNNGKKGTIEKIKNVSGEVKWDDPLPIKIPAPESGQNSIYLKSKNLEDNASFETDVYVRDSLNNQQIYRIIKTSGLEPALRMFQIQ